MSRTGTFGVQVSAIAESILHFQWNKIRSESRDQIFLLLANLIALTQ